MFEGYAWVAWLGVALALGAVEAATVNFVFLMLAGGALGGSVAAAAGAGFPVQVVVAVAVAGLLLGGVRPWVRRRFSVKSARTTMIGAAANVGRSAFVLETVTNTSGRVKLAGETWSARTSDPQEYEPGEEVRVVAIDGATAVVTRVPAHRVGP